MKLDVIKTERKFNKCLQENVFEDTDIDPNHEGYGDIISKLEQVKFEDSGALYHAFWNFFIDGVKYGNYLAKISSN